MLPPFNCVDETVCCDQLYVVATRISEVGLAAMCECCDTPSCESFARYVTFGEPHSGGDYIAVWISRMTPAPSAPAAQGHQILPRQRVTYSVKVRESGWPNLDASGGRPAPAEYDQAAHFAYGHLEFVLRKIVDAMRRNEFGTGPYQAFDGLTFRAADADGIAWVFDITMDINWSPLG